MTLTNFPNGISSFGVPVLPPAGGTFTGKVFFVAPGAANASDGNRGDSLSAPFATLYKAHSVMTAGNNDVCYLVGNGSSTGSARLSTALAQTVDSTATAGTLNWTKNACHLIGITAPTTVAQRARIAPPTGTYTQATFGSGNFVVVSASGCMFSNISLFNGFSTGGTNQICWTDSGGRNFYNNVDFGGMGDAASAQNTGSRCVLITGSTGENTFVGCTLGLDTVDRTVANAQLEFAAATPRNSFYNCKFLMRATNAGVLCILGTGAGCMDRMQYFDNCSFINAMASGATAQTVIASMTNASPGGGLVLKNCTLVGNTSTNWGDANALAVSWIDGAAPTAGTSGIAVNPT